MNPELGQLMQPTYRRQLAAVGRLLSDPGKIGSTLLRARPEYAGAGRLWLLGEAPGPNTRPDCPLFPYPATSAGGRLHAMLGLSYEVYFSMRRANLIPYYPGPGGVPAEAARSAATLLVSQLAPGDRVLGFGTKVRDALGLRTQPALTWRQDIIHGRLLSWAHHPSGLSRHYNTSSNQQDLRDFVRGCLSPTAPP